MRLSLVLLAASGPIGSAADWSMGRELEGRGGHLIHARQTRASRPDGATGWTPKPTEPPIAAEMNPLELARRRNEWIRAKRQTSENTWIDDHTCGWRAGTPSAAFICPSSATCATNSDQVVACDTNGASTNFFTVCFDYQASLNGYCESMGPKTGCCMTSSIGACITYIWPEMSGTSARSMFRCSTAQSIITMLSEPQFVLDGRTKSTSTTSTSSSTASVPDDPSATAPTITPVPSDSGTNVGAIVGGVVGGVAGIALIAGAIAFFLLRSRKKDPKAGSPHYSAVAPADTSYPGPGGMTQQTGYNPAGSPALSQAGYFSPSMMTAPVNSTTPPAPGAYDPQQGYYAPNEAAIKYAPHPSHTPPSAGYAPYPGASPPPGNPYPPSHQHMSELDTNAVSGAQGNPAEMAADSAVQR